MTHVSHIMPQDTAVAHVGPHLHASLARNGRRSLRL